MEIHPLEKYDGHMNTYTKVKFNLLNPDPKSVNILDIAKGLANQAHFNGQTPKFFSVAQHSIAVYQTALSHGANPELAFVALMHDAAEAYTGDLIKPIKILIPDFKKIENKILQAIFQHWGLNGWLLERVKPFDLEVQRKEYAQFYKDEIWFEYLNPNDAYELFLETYSVAHYNYLNFFKLSASVASFDSPEKSVQAAQDDSTLNSPRRDTFGRTLNSQL